MYNGANWAQKVRVHTRLFETFRYFETTKSVGAPTAPAAPASLPPLFMYVHYTYQLLLTHSSKFIDTKKDEI